MTHISINDQHHQPANTETIKHLEEVDFVRQTVRILNCRVIQYSYFMCQFVVNLLA